MNGLIRDAGAAETELRNQEERVITALGAAGIASDELTTAITRYREPVVMDEKDRLFNGILAAAGRAPRPVASVDDPLLRRAADELAGAQNRRQIALRNRQERVAAYNEGVRSLRGSIGRAFTRYPEKFPS